MLTVPKQVTNTGILAETTHKKVKKKKKTKQLKYLLKVSETKREKHKKWGKGVVCGRTTCLAFSRPLVFESQH